MAYADLIRRLGHQRWFARLVIWATPLDRAVQNATGGRWSLVGRKVFPGLVLTTTGKTSGLPREVPLLYARDGDAYVLVASNLGQPHHPAWSGNLLANPRASIMVDGALIPVEATVATAQDRARVWPLVTAVWPAYDTYVTRTDRDVRVFLVRPVPA